MTGVQTCALPISTGLDKSNGEERTGDDLPTMRVEVTVALEKIYGVAAPPANDVLPDGHQSPPAAIVDVEEVKP